MPINYIRSKVASIVGCTLGTFAWEIGDSNISIYLFWCADFKCQWTSIF